ncbi:S41 family peptidase [Paraferrimonas sp. SM1919]|uniref:S41 family peptidase n=1 Tax=Paraferrimonas sp. SM1919 TaxID=2662263 RepID=UPI0013D4C84F|nr:S41 family peptidase [Paraferrimonas sp. SM1919]
MKFEHYILSAVVALTIVGCGGGSSSSDSTSRGSTPQGWQFEVYQPETNFDGLCANPRASNEYNDSQGTILDENNFLRSWSNNTYLWYDEIDDVDPELYNDPIAYFDILKTFAITASGKPKDRFHFSYNTEQYEALSQGGVSSGYGIEWALLSASPPRDLRVAYTEANSPAAAAAIQRGAKIIAIDGVDVANGNDVDTLNAGMSPSKVGQTVEFEVLDLGATETRKVKLTSQNIISSSVLTTKIVNTSSGDVGYIVFNSFNYPAEKELFDAITMLKSNGISDLILDLRYNGGGLLYQAAQLGYMIAGDQSRNRVFELTSFNNKHPNINPVTGQALSPVPFIDEGLGFSVDTGTKLPTLDLSRVYILTSNATASASESLINGLNGIDIEVIQIGQTTTGKPYGFYPKDNCGTTYFTVQIKGVNAKGFGDFSDGFAPENANLAGTVPQQGCYVREDFMHSLGDPSEVLLNTALNFRDYNQCPPIPVNLTFEAFYADTFDKDLAIGQNDIKQVIKNSKIISTKVIPTR